MVEGILKSIEDQIKQDGVNISDKDSILRKIEKLSQKKLNILFVGATGVGKSSTINSIFNMELAKVGYSVDPETTTIQKFEINNIVLWDSPGLGDSPINDQRYAVEIANMLKKRDADGQLLIDEVVVLIDASSRDLSTTYEIIENAIMPFIGDPKRIIIAINQCDMAMKGRYWNYNKNEPDEQLLVFLDNKVNSVKERIYGSTGLITNPIYYSALHSYNISKLLLEMLKAVSEEKRFLFTDSLNKKPQVWKKNDEIESYNKEIQKEVKGSILKALDGAAKGASAGATVGSLVPVIGTMIGATAGAILGFLGGLFEG